MSKQDLPKPPPEAVLIRLARQARGLTIAEAASEGASIIKASRWGQIENGYLMKSGVALPTLAGHMQLAHMARIVGVSPDELEGAGRGEAAAILRRILQYPPSRPTPRERLADFMQDRVRDLGVAWVEAVQGRADVLKYDVEFLDRQAIERALGWAPDSVAAILAGGEPSLVRSRETREARTAALHRELNEEREKLRALTEEIADDDVRTAVRMLEALADREAG